jgi:NhaP-type Na+/H+ or K+/H+ antiporter
MVVWLIFGALLVDLLGDLTWGAVAFAILALTLLRMLPVAIALVGCGLSRESVAFVGWFGPRGLASIVFGVIALDALPSDAGAEVISIVALTVLLSVLLHGVTASPFARRYGEHTAALERGQPEVTPPPGLPPIPQRRGDHHRQP